ncbi:subtilisin-like protease SBT4.14 [Momordica charantia]|uniref:Subtilisin-like protease SBT4.14 n=1 Tax=Momordica charantia TaxID=3673 RepID=A0A6J1DQP5_MOMCH|nr:subtilisin-like protease SBT4.14 [Momordica charantia]
MSKDKTFCVVVFVLLSIIGYVFAVENDQEKKHFIIFLKNNEIALNNEVDAAETHLNVLKTVKESHVDAKESMVHSYTKSLNAFAASLTGEEAQKLAKMGEVHSVIPNTYRKLQTTRSWDFIGLPSNATRHPQHESNIIVGVFDTGITPTAESFKDNGFGPPPKKWKGTCQHFANFSGCNNKLIGARYFKLDKIHDPIDILSPVDVNGHGTHTASTAAGNAVPGANLFGLAEGTARGAVPSARIAIYKVCWASRGCADMDMLAAFDAAIRDGVHIISVSVGEGGFGNYAEDAVSIGAFHAMKNGIVTVAAAGNNGPATGSVINHAPWILTVGASWTDRTFTSRVELGNGKSISGMGINTFNPRQKMFPLVDGADVASNNPQARGGASICAEGSLDPAKVKGHLVLCRMITWGSDSVVKSAGADGTILQSDQFLDHPHLYMTSATMVSTSDGASIDAYIRSTRTPTAVIYKSTEVKTPAPLVASFSSRGPNPGSTRILKPDIVAPGVNILATFTPLKSLTGLKGDTQFSKFTIESGTSMACPHAAGAAAYVKSFHPDWSPAAIRSALITTATPISRRMNAEGEFAYGAGNLNPERAVNPGLIYDDDEMSYVKLLCSERYSQSSIATLTGPKPVNCASLMHGLSHDSLNYPTIQLSLQNTRTTTVAEFQRQVTNVGHAVSVYHAIVSAPPGVEITVSPTTLSFTHVLQKLTFKVVVEAGPLPPGKMESGLLTWKTAGHVVRSPIVVYSPSS